MIDELIMAAHFSVRVQHIAQAGVKNKMSFSCLQDATALLSADAGNNEDEKRKKGNSWILYRKFIVYIGSEKAVMWLEIECEYAVRNMQAVDVNFGIKHLHSN